MGANLLVPWTLFLKKIERHKSFLWGHCFALLRSSSDIYPVFPSQGRFLACFLACISGVIPADCAEISLTAFLMQVLCNHDAASYSDLNCQVRYLSLWIEAWYHDYHFLWSEIPSSWSLHQQAPNKYRMAAHRVWWMPPDENSIITRCQGGRARLLSSNRRLWMHSHHVTAECSNVNLVTSS